MRALVTGGGGFLGSRIAQMLHECGHEVTALGRKRYPHHESAGIKCVQADIRNLESTIASCQNIDTVFHVASMTGVWGRRKDFWDINVEGTKNVLAACRANHISKLVYTSSPSVVCGREEIRGADESLPYPAHFVAHYPASKATAEKLVLGANDDALSTVALRPHLIWGPGDPHLIPRVINRARMGKLKQVGDGKNLVDITYVDNAAAAHLAVADHLEVGSPCAGKPYFISQGQPVEIWTWFNALLQNMNVPPVSKKISFRTAYAVGAALEVFHRIFMPNVEPLMTRFVATQLAKTHYFDISAARRDFGYDPKISTEAGMDFLLKWLRANEKNTRQSTENNAATSPPTADPVIFQK